MRFSTVAALCAAPLALAGTLQAELAARGAVALEARMPGSESQSSSSSSKDGSSSNDGSKGSSSSNNNNGDSRDSRDDDSDNNIIIQSTTIQDVIIIWVNEGGGAATSTVTDTKTVTAIVEGSTAAAAPPPGSTVAAAGAVTTHTVVVGGSAGLVYTPDTIEAAVGDMVVFSFESQNHTATQSAFTTPCEPLAGGMDTQFKANINNTVSPPPQVAMQVTVSTPIWFYCRQSGHCGKGMTFSINPTANKTQAAFKQMAIAQNGTGAASPITGSTASVAAAPPPAATSAASSSSSSSSDGGASGVTQGSGTVNSGGSCDCSCLCGVAAFPNADVQGIGGYGGMSGSIALASLEG